MRFSCKNCGTEIESGWKVCPECGADIHQDENTTPCPSCGFQLKPSWNICPQCKHRIRDTKIDKSSGIQDKPNNNPDRPTHIKPGDISLERENLVKSRGYSIVDKLPSGGMADLFIAEKDGQKVVFKFLKAEFENDREYIKRFISEAKRSIGLNHPNIVKIFEYEDDENAAVQYYIMEYLASGTLADQIRERGKFSVEDATAIILQLASALQTAHETVPTPIVHRDIKPSNILFDGRRVVLTDFGIAKTIGGYTQMTTFGQIVGSGGYMSPEQLRGQIDKIDHRTDIYSLGVVFYKLLTGKEPFEGPNEASVTTQHLMKPVVPPGVLEPSVQPYISGIVVQMMEKDQEKRLANMGVLMRLLSQKPNQETEQHYTRIHALFQGAYEQGSDDTEGKTLIKKPAESFGFNLNADDQFLKLCNMWMQYQAGVGMPMGAPSTTSTVFSCPNCKNIIQSDDKVCTHCGIEIEKLKRKCPNCGTQYLEGHAFCTKCKRRFLSKEFIDAKEKYKKNRHEDSHSILSRIENLRLMVKDNIEESEWIKDLLLVLVFKNIFNFNYNKRYIGMHEILFGHESIEDFKNKCKELIEKEENKFKNLENLYRESKQKSLPILVLFLVCYTILVIIFFELNSSQDFLVTFSILFALASLTYVLFRHGKAQLAQNKLNSIMGYEVKNRVSFSEIKNFIETIGNDDNGSEKYFGNDKKNLFSDVLDIFRNNWT